MFGKKVREQIKVIKDKKLEPDFEPSTKTLVRIFKILVDKGPDAKTAIALSTKLNYTRLAKHIVWMEQKGLVESKIKDNKIDVSLTLAGREFATVISKIKKESLIVFE